LLGCGDADCRLVHDLVAHSERAGDIVQGEAVGFVSGFAHPISGLDHIVAMVAVGLWGAQLGRPAIWLLPVTFPLVMAVGGFVGLIGVHLPGSEIAIALSGVCLGAAVLRYRLFEIDRLISRTAAYALLTGTWPPPRPRSPTGARTTR